MLEQAPSRITPGGQHKTYWKCQCDCGNVVEVPYTSLVRGNSHSCGCLRRSLSTKPMIGKTFGELYVEAQAETKHYECNRGELRYVCRCSCGNTTIVSGTSLRSGHTKTCGHCAEIDGTPVGKTRLYRIWSGMKNRCFNPHEPAYKNYGARGITVCDEWRDDFHAFAEWSLSHGYAENLSIDRIENDGIYSPDNCRWATDLTQANNTRNNINIEIDGETHTLAEWSRISGVGVTTIRCRLKLGWDVTRAVFQVPRGQTNGLEET